MRFDRITRAVSLLAACASLAACGDGTAPKLSPITVDSLFAELAESQAFGAPGLIFTGPMAVGRMPNAAACPFNSANQRFVCAPLVAGGITTNRYFQLLDASGAAQSEFNRATTAALRTVADVAGTISIDLPAGGMILPTTITLTIASFEDQTLSGLLTGTHTLNGSGNSTSTFDDAELPETLTSSWVTTNVVLPKRGDANRYPKSGTMVVTLTFAEFTSTVTMTFDGTSIMTMTIVSGGLTQTCTVNMADPDSFPVCGD